MEDHLGQMETQNQQLEDENTPVLGRRKFLTGSVSLGAAVLGAGALAGVQTAQVAESPTIDWRTVERGGIESFFSSFPV